MFTYSSDWIDPTSLTLVYTGNLNSDVAWDYNPDNMPWVEFAFDTPFEYNGVDNLVLYVEDNSASAEDPYLYRGYKSSTSTANRSIFIFDIMSNGFTPLDNPTGQAGLLFSQRSDIQFNLCQERPAIAFADTFFVVERPGIYTITDTVPGSNGCDSVITRILTVDENVPLPVVVKSNDCEWDYNGTYRTCEDYTVTYDGNPVPECTACTTTPGTHQYILPTGDTVVFVDVYGKLYSWYSSARVPEGDDSAVPADSLWPYGTYVQGICPAGWALPTVEDYMDMYVASGGQAGLVKSPSTEVWLPGKQGIAPNLFNAYGAGYYEGGINRYFNLLGETHFWASDYSANSSTSSNFVLNYYCDSAQFQENLKGLGYSIRCVKRIYVLPE